MDSGKTVSFLLNHQSVATLAPAGLLLLDFLRKQLRLPGTKEGCKEGDCGACMVLVGDLQADGTVRYQPMTSCLMPLGECAGRHIVTIEGLNFADRLSPVQAALVAEGASQCGYCTPGIVVSMTGLLMDPSLPVDAETIRYALSGNLCRCTGYRSLRDSHRHLAPLARRFTARRIEDLLEAEAIPSHFAEAPAILRELQSSGEPSCDRPEAIRIAGGTDLYVQRGEEIPTSPVALLHAHPQLGGITREGDRLRVGALTTFEAFGREPEVLAAMPAMPEWLLLMASWQIRNRATVGGNLVNASPIGDMTSLLMALDSELTLLAGEARRNVLLRDFYLGYKTLAKQPDELVESIAFELPAANETVNWEKVSKRTYLDIATVNSGCRITVEAGTVTRAVLSYGGIAATPMQATQTAASLIGKPLDAETMRTALDVLQAEISPISDVRGSADYKRLLARQFTLAHFAAAGADISSVLGVSV